MTFRDLRIGDTFEFDHTRTLCGGFAHGPWRKISARTYDRHDVPPHPGTGAYRVGSIAARVLTGELCGRTFTVAVEPLP
jgi:hypothetical protein